MNEQGRKKRRLQEVSFFWFDFAKIKVLRYLQLEVHERR